MEGRYSSLQGKNIIVVGTGGIGGAIVRDFLSQGSIVFALDKNEKVLEGLLGPGDDRESKLKKHLVDVTDFDGYKRLIRTIGEGCRPKPIYAFVYTAGIGESTPVGNTSHELAEKLFQLNVLGFVDSVEAVVPYLNRGSSITVVSSINAYRSEHGMSVYDSTKAALKQFAQTIAADLGSKGIRVNAVAPGYIRTLQTVKELKNPVSKKRIEDATALGRIGEPEDVSGIVVALSSTDFEFVTGACIEISGGLALTQYPPIEKQKQAL